MLEKTRLVHARTENKTSNIKRKTIEESNNVVENKEKRRKVEGEEKKKPSNQTKNGDEINQP